MELPYTCVPCNRSYSTMKLLTEHKITSHQQLSIICQFCYVIFKTRDEADQHVESMHVKGNGQINLPKPEPMTECPHWQCGLQLTEHNLSAHIKAAHMNNKRHKSAVEPIMVCTHCQTELPTAQMNDHVRQIHPETVQEQIVEIPSNAKDENGNFKCPRCPDTFPYDMLLRQHMAGDHYGLDATRCHAVGSSCTHVFAKANVKDKKPSLDQIRKHVLQSHLKHVLAPLIKLAKCKHCPTAFSPNKTQEGANQIQHYINKHFDRIMEMKEMYDKQFQNGRLRCPRCPETFYFQELLTQHDMIIHQVKPLQCALCPEKKNSEYSVLYHVISVHLKGHIESLKGYLGDRKKLSCPVCKKHMTNNTIAATHMMFKHEEESFNAIVKINPVSLDIEPEEEADAEEADQFNDEDQENIYKCGQCPEVLYFGQLLQQHTGSAHSVDPHQCVFCKQNFNSNPNKLMFHVLTVHMKETIVKLTRCMGHKKKCPVCQNSMRSPTVAATHLLYNHKEQAFDYMSKGEQQPKEKKKDSFDVINTAHDKLMVDIHALLRNQTNIDMKKCPECNEELFYNALMKQHLAVAHNGADKTMCVVCNAVIKDSLEEHMIREHVPGMANYLCSVTRCFHCPQVLQNHTAHYACRHMGKLHELDVVLQKKLQRAPYRCNDCSLSFFFHQLYNQHKMTVHIKYDMCAMCPSNYTGTTLTHHVVTDHMKEVFAFLMELINRSMKQDKCPICKREMKFHGGLVKHLVLQHEEEVYEVVKGSIELNNEPMEKSIEQQNQAYMDSLDSETDQSFVSDDTPAKGSNNVQNKTRQQQNEAFLERLEAEEDDAPDPLLMEAIRTEEEGMELDENDFS